MREIAEGPIAAGEHGAAHDGVQWRVLVVDDEVNVLDILRDFLTDQNYYVETAGSGEEGIDKLRTQDFDLVVADINLPGIDGLEVVRSAKAHDENICIIVVTGFASTSTAIEALRQGAYDYVTKPFDLREVAQIIERGLERRRLTIENKRLLRSLTEVNVELQRHEQILKEQVKTKTRRMTTLYEAGKQISASLDLEDSLAIIVAKALELAPGRESVIFLLEENENNFVLRSASSGRVAQAGQWSFRKGDGFHGMVVETQRPAIISDMSNVGGDPLIPQMGFRSLVVVPLINKGVVIGTLDVLDKEPRKFAKDDEEVLTLFGAQAANAIANAQLFEKIKELDRLKSDFVAVVSHEIRTPLTSIKGSLELLAETPAFDYTPDQKELLEICQANTERLTVLVNDILDFSKMESSRLSMSFEQTDLRSILTDAVRNIEKQADRREQRISVVMPDSSVTVMADPNRIAQVLTNLLGNAIKFSETGTTIDITVSEEAEFAQVAIHDQGPGIRSEDVPKLFEKFRQLDGSSTRRVGGTGLGLVICKRIVEQHGGRIWVESEPSKGSTFTFTLRKTLVRQGS